MDLIKITGSDKSCEISGEDFSYSFENGHPVKLIKGGKNLEPIPYPQHGGKNMKSKTRLVHKYWDSALVLTRYTGGFETLEVKYRVFSNGEIKKETIY